jgi:hypothetical protein
MRGTTRKYSGGEAASISLLTQRGFVRRANSLSAGVRLCRAERGVLRAKADDVGGNADLRSRP